MVQHDVDASLDGGDACVTPQRGVLVEDNEVVLLASCQLDDVQELALCDAGETMSCLFQSRFTMRLFVSARFRSS